MKKSFKRKLDLNSDQIQRLSESEAKKAVGGSDSQNTIDWSKISWTTASIDWEGTRSWPW